MVQGIDPSHVRMREMVARLFEYFTFEWQDPSGYPYEGIQWNEQTRTIEPIRQYTQITAIGQAGEFLAGIVNGEIVFPLISVREALDLLDPHDAGLAERSE